MFSLSCETFLTGGSHPLTRPQPNKYTYSSVFHFSESGCLAGKWWRNALFGIPHVMLWLASLQLFLCDYSGLPWGPIYISRSHQTRGRTCFVKRTESHRCFDSCLAVNSLYEDVDFPQRKMFCSVFLIKKKNMSDWTEAGKGIVRLSQERKLAHLTPIDKL